VTTVGQTYYFYDGEGRVCAVQSYPFTGGVAAYGYLYDAEGTRVAKGSITPSPNLAAQPLSCDPAANGFQITQNYVLGPSGEELTMLDGNNNWQRTNVYAAGKLIGTYDALGLHFHLEDPLGTRRMQLSGELANIGQPETDIQSLPNGDGLNPFSDQYAPATADDATPLHFTGKERDTESGNDYFGARYYASSVGRFLSPDAPVDQHPNNPQSWNLYTYVRNNPLGGVDPDGNFDCGALTAAQCTQVGTNLTTAQRQLDTAWTNGTITDNQYLTGSAAIFAYGTMNDHNGVTVNVGETQDNAPAMTNASQGGKITAANPTGQDIQVTFRPGFLESANSDTTAQVTGHEGSHVEDAEDWAKAGYTEAARPTRFETEFRAYGVTSIFGEAQGYGILHGSMNGGQSYLFWEKIFPEPLNNALRATMIRALYPVSDAKAFKDNTKEGHQ
jgi:RHS repeat-associated protein